MQSAPHDPEEFDSDLSAGPLLSLVENPQVSRGRRIATVLTGFLLGQGTAQGLSVLSGMFLVRALSIEAYAQYGLATAFQTVFSVLMDLGFASTIVPLVGERRDDRALVGRYVRSAKHLRDRLFLFLAPLAAIAFLSMVHKRHWPWSVQLLLLASVILSLYSGGKVSYFSAPLFVFGKLREYYQPLVISATGRILSYVALALSGGLNAWTAAGFGALNITLNSELLRKASQRYIVWPRQDDAATDREMLHYIVPAMPALIFSAFQSQLTLFLIGIFGGTQSIAEVTALSRIAQFFTVLMTFNVIVIEPFLARLNRARLFRTYLSFVLIACTACIPLILIAYRFPGAYIWLIGAKYESTRSVMGLYLLSSSISFIAGLMWIMNRARKWVFWSGSIVEVALLIGVQSIVFAIMGLKTTRQAVLFTIASACCGVVAHGYVAVRGFLLKPAAADLPAAS